MSPGLIKMWISFIAMFLMIGAAGLIVLSRSKLRGFFKTIIAIIAYLLFFLAALLMLFVIMSTPS